jgi:hypothetical protein
MGVGVGAGPGHGAGSGFGFGLQFKQQPRFRMLVPTIHIVIPNTINKTAGTTKTAPLTDSLTKLHRTKKIPVKIIPYKA